MNEWIYYDIPRMYTALAQWCACIIYICISDKRYRLPQTACIAIGFLPIQCMLMHFTKDFTVYLWLPVMLLSTALMFLMLWTLCSANAMVSLYNTVCGFLMAEAIAASEWLIHYFIVYIHGYTSVILEYVILFLFYGFCFLLLWVMEKRLLNRAGKFAVSPKELRMTIGIVGFIFVFSNLSYIYPDTPFSSRLFYEVFRIRAFIDIFGMILIFFLQYQIRTQILEIESKVINMTLRSQYDRYMHQQTDNEIINMKYHDLKHQIAALRAETDLKKREGWLDCMEKEIDTYQMAVDTGNKVLDVILENKIRSIEKYDIDFTYIVDGKCLSFMHVTDICTIFGNAIDNAVEAEIIEPEAEKRMISLSVSVQRKMTYIKIENYVSHPEEIQIHSLETTKSDKSNHGYGIKSIRYCVEKYQGNMSIKLSDNWFSMSIIIPSRDR